MLILKMHRFITWLETLKGMALSDIVINKLNPNTGKSEYINALAHISIGGLPRACELLQIAIGFGYTQAQVTFDQRCK